MEANEISIALELWRRWRVERAREQLIATLSSAWPWRRSAAARLLGFSQSQKTLSALLDALGDANALVRWSAAQALARRHDDVALEQLWGQFREADLSARAAALDALARRPDVSPAELGAAIVVSLGATQPAELRLAALQALALRPDPDLSPMLAS